MNKSNVKQVGNFENDGGISIFHDFMDELLKSIMFYLAQKQEEELVAAIDLLTFTAEHYQVNPRIRVETIHKWQVICTADFDRNHRFNPAEHTSGWMFERRNVIVDTFSRLEAASKRYPTIHWDNFEED
jgi:hypothetical protein